jgi:hypothetical protein
VKGVAWGVVHLAVLAAVLLGLRWHASVHQAHGRAEVQAKWDAEKIHQAAQAIDDTQRLHQAQQEIQRVASLARAHVDADVRRAADVRLHDAAHAFAGPVPGPAEPVGLCAAADARARVLADVLSEVDDFAGAVAAEADRARVAGIECQQSYDSLTTIHPGETNP